MKDIKFGSKKQTWKLLYSPKGQLERKTNKIRDNIEVEMWL
jgi:uncharacterized protein YlbG (UPF0298 family)